MTEPGHVQRITPSARASTRLMAFVHHLVEDRAAADPDAIALRFRDSHLPYGELNRRANQLACHIAARGVGAEARVVVCVEPGLDVVVALIAILKVGATYVPIDPAYPLARTRSIIEETRPHVILTQSHLIERFAFDVVRTMALDSLSAVLDSLPRENAARTIAPEQTAYIYYTSGTTGTPKGVMASYSNLAHYIGVAQSRYGFTSRDSMPAIARFSFSISLFELLTPLVSGGTVVILERDHILDFARMSRTLSETTFFHAGPSLLRNLLFYIRRHYPSFRAFSGVRHASSGGDMVPADMLETLKEIFSNADVFVIYGCSEISCMGCTYLTPRDRAIDRTYVGEPFADTTVRVLDASFQSLGVGEVGEIHFAGAGVVKGYLNRPELTSEKFVLLEGRRFYRTGDMGRMSAEGRLEILGRSDFQVKVRGMRVELGEVEHTLRRAPGVLDAVVAARDVDGSKSLVAYVVMRPEDNGTASLRAPAISEYVASQLPDYMVPSAYVQLERLPLNFNMKVDRQALPPPGRASHVANAALSVSRRGPETPTERHLCLLWQKVLGVEGVGVDDNFFELGGDSLLALKLVLEIDRELGVVIEGMDVLRESLRVQAAICDTRLGKAASATPCLPGKVDEFDPIDLFHFGREQSLHGVLHDARARARSVANAVLICPPVGYEFARAHFVLQRLARRLAAQHIPVLRFDYYGCGDSLGENAEATMLQWQHDIAAAYTELRQRVNPSRVIGVGVRLGATLLWNSAGGLDFAKLVLWDPVWQGADYCAHAAEGHRRYLQALDPPRLCKSRRRDGSRELLGFMYSARALQELRALAISRVAGERVMPVQCLASSHTPVQQSAFRATFGDSEACRIELAQADSSWDDVARLEEILPDTGLSTQLARMVTEQP